MITDVATAVCAAVNGGLLGAGVGATTRAWLAALEVKHRNCRCKECVTLLDGIEQTKQATATPLTYVGRTAGMHRTCQCPTCEDLAKGLAEAAQSPMPRRRALVYYWVRG